MREMENEKTLYICDPDKAVGCSKQCETVVRPECYMTSHKEWAALENVTFTTFYADNVPCLQALSIALPIADWFALEAQPFFRELVEYLRKIETQENSNNIGVERD